MPIKVFVVDDSPFMRRIISDILNTDDNLEVIDYAGNGKEALEKLKVINPDVITLDVEMPIMDGISTLKEITKNYKIPVIMLSSLTREGADSTLSALDHGAIDFITKPTNIFKIGSFDKKQEIIEKVKVVSKVNTVKNNKCLNNLFRNKENLQFRDNDEFFSTIIAIGTSTGGPRALQEIIPNIPQGFNGSIAVVQHMPPGFTKSLANRLDNISSIKVKEGEDGEKMKRGFCYIAPGDLHMKIVEKNDRFFIQLDNGPQVSSHRPSVDVLMESVSELKNIKKLGVILTGMGSDGAKGIKKIKNNNGYTIAQNEESCVVFGMPKSAINIDGASVVLPLNKIVFELLNKMEV